MHACRTCAIVSETPSLVISPSCCVCLSCLSDLSLSLHCPNAHRHVHSSSPSSFLNCLTSPLVAKVRGLQSKEAEHQIEAKFMKLDHLSGLPHDAWCEQVSSVTEYLTPGICASQPCKDTIHGELSHRAVRPSRSCLQHEAECMNTSVPCTYHFDPA